MPEMHIDAGRINSVFNPQRCTGLAALFELLTQFVLRDNFLDAALNQLQLFVDGRECLTHGC